MVLRRLRGRRRCLSCASPALLLTKRFLLAGLLVFLMAVVGFHSVLSEIESAHQEIMSNGNIARQLKLAPSQNFQRKRMYYADAEGSARDLLRAAQTPRRVPDDIIDQSIEEERCKRYNLKYSGRRTRRRIFYGTNIADDSWHILASLALESYGIFHTVAFSESNRTHSNQPRKLRFAHPGSERSKVLADSGMYGPRTQVFVDLYVNEKGWPKGNGYEGAQLTLVVERWRRQGMREDDIGYIGDADEFFSRDYLRAMQICDVEQFDGHNNCEKCRISGDAAVFEGGPRCWTTQAWSHPDLIVGACIEGISSSAALHPVPERTWNGIGWLGDGYTPGSKFKKLPSNSTHFPLYNAFDFRSIRGHQHKARGFGKGISYTSFHLHNFFPNVQVMRNKYATYGEAKHSLSDLNKMSLAELNPQTRLMLSCVTNKTIDVEKGRIKLWDADWLSSVKGPLPLAFQVPGYSEMRMRELLEMVTSDRVG